MRRLLAALLPALCLTQAVWAASVQDVPPASPDELEIRGHLLPRRYATLASEIGGKAQRVAVREGDRFQEGQSLVTLDCSILRAQLDRAKAVLAEAEKVRSSNRRLVELKTAGELEAQTAELETAKARGDVNVLQATLGKCAVAAPFSGRVAEQKVREQQYVQPGQALLDVIDDSALEIECIVPSRWLTWLRPGHPFQFQVAETGKSYAAKVSRLGAKADPVSQSIKVVGELVTGPADLLAGMSGRVLMSPPAPKQ